MAKGLIDTILDSIFDESWVGRRGEKLTERELKLVNLFGRKGKTLRNLYVPKDNGETSEIDVVYITQKGIFVFESKNYSGWIFGDEKGMYWTVSLPNGQKNRFYNPIKQNRTHLKWLGQFLGADVPLFSIVVFSERCELKKISVESNDIKVIKRDRTYATVRELWEKSDDALSEDQITALFEKLKVLTNVDEAVKLAHIRDIEYMKNRPAKRVPLEKTSENTGLEQAPQRFGEKICPRCGKPLVLRTAKKGDHAGEQFYGCSGFPGCRYTEKA